MIFISKIIHDPNQSHPNKMGNTIGLVFYTPKYWDCHDYNFYSNQFDEMRNGELSEKEMEHRYQIKRAHRNCKRRHRSHKGYMYWMGPKRRYEFRYMGALNSYHQVWWKPFSIHAHGQYVRLLDNGPQNPPQRNLQDDEHFQEIMRVMSQRLKDAMNKAEATMNEYERIRERR